MYDVGQYRVFVPVIHQTWKLSRCVTTMLYAVCFVIIHKHNEVIVNCANGIVSNEHGDQ